MQTVVKGTTSQAFDVDVGQTVTVTPGSGSSMLVEYTTDGEVAIRNNSATWQAWTAGTVSVVTSDVCMYPLYARVTAYTASGSYDVAGSGLQDTRSNSVAWKRDVVSPRDSSSSAAVVGAAGVPFKRIFQNPYKLASFGDSRANVNRAVPDVSGSTSSLAINKGPSWTAAFRGDTEFSFNYGVSGDVASGWASPSRTGGKTYTSFVGSGVDMVHIQYGVNDILTGNGTTPTAATICGHLQALVLEAVKSGILVAIESILPCTAAGWTSAGSGTAEQKKAICDSVNTTMRAWSLSVPSVVYVDTATQVSTSDGYANPDYYVDSVHLNNRGAMVSGRAVAGALALILPVKNGIFYPSGIQSGPNFVDMVSPPITVISTGIAGTFNVESQTVGYSQIYGPYIEFRITPLTLSSGEATLWAAVGGDVGGFGATAKYELSANDVLQGQCRILIDDGVGGVPVGLRNFVVRQRCYYQAGGGVYADFGSFATPSTQSNFNEVIDHILTITPRITTTIGSAGIEPPTHAKGYGLHLYVSVSTLDAFRVRLYAPMLRKAT